MRQDLLIKDINPCVDRIAVDLIPVWFLKKVGYCAGSVGCDDAILAGFLRLFENQRCGGILLVVVLECGGEITVGQRVAADDEKRVV